MQETLSWLQRNTSSRNTIIVITKQLPFMINKLLYKYICETMFAGRNEGLIQEVHSSCASRCSIDSSSYILQLRLSEN